MIDYVYGRRAVLEALKSRQVIREIWISQTAQGSVLDDVRTLARSKSVPVKSVEPKRIDEKAGKESHQGVVALVETSHFEYADMQSIIDHAADAGVLPAIAILDGITDTHNLGAIIRSAECAGFNGVIIPKHGSAEVNNTVIKTSAGAAWHVPVVQVTNLVQAIKELKKSGLWIYGMDAQADRPIYDIDVTSGLAIVIGSEGVGMRRLVKEHCDFLVNIPQRGKIDSLNASVSAGIVFFEVVRRRLTQ